MVKESGLGAPYLWGAHAQLGEEGAEVDTSHSSSHLHARWRAGSK